MSFKLLKKKNLFQFNVVLLKFLFIQESIKKEIVTISTKILSSKMGFNIDNYNRVPTHFPFSNFIILKPLCRFSEHN